MRDKRLSLLLVVLLLFMAENVAVLYIPGITDEVVSFRPALQPEIDGAEYVQFLSAFDDCAWNLVSRADPRLLYKCSLLVPGDRIRVYGQVRCTQTGFVILVRDVVAFR